MATVERRAVRIAGILGFLLAGNIVAQTPKSNQARPAETPQPPAQSRQVFRPAQGAEASTDQEIAALLLIDAKGEVKMGRFAESRAYSPEVKQLARHLVEDHSKTVQALEPLAGPSATAADSQAANGQAQVGGKLDMVAAKKQIANECSAWQEKELSKKQGADFDLAFAGSQLNKHMEVICTERVLRQYASPNLQQAIDQDLQAAEHHLQIARDVLAKLTSANDGGTAASGANRSHQRPQ